jgi:hypothetical protein
VIAKHVPMRVLRKSSMAGLVGYLTDQQGLTERVGDIRITHCEAATLSAAVSEMLAVQQLNTRALSDLTYHLLVSFQTGENPSPETLAAIEGRLCKALGFEGHQRISVVHHDTDHLHMHIGINKVHPQRLTLKEPYLAYKTLAVMCERLEREYGLQAVNHTPRRGVGEGKAADMEQHAAIESLMSWVRRECLDLVHAATTWQELHHVLADHGLELRERGAGLVFASQDGTFVKASTVDRGLSKKALEARLGAFQAPVSLARPWASKSYRKGPVRSHVDTTELYARYRAQREAVGDQRAAALDAARKRKAEAIAAAKRAYALQRAAIRLSDGKGIDKRLVYATASFQMRQRLQAIYRGYEAQRASILKDRQRHTWADWLKAEAFKGDREALAALRARTVASKLRGHTVRAQGLTEATGASPEVESVTKAGTVVYRSGASAVRDDGQQLQVSRAADQDAVQAALKLARQRYGDRITVSGSQQFRAAVVRAAVELALPVTFTDPGLERQRQALMRKEPLRGTDERRGPDQRDDGRPARAARSGTDAAGTARHAHGRKPNPGGAPKGAPPRSRHRVPDLPERDVAGQRAGRELLLPGDVRHGVEQQGAQAPDALRRSVDRAGREEGVSRPPVGRPGLKAPPMAEARLRTGAGVGVRAPTAPRPAPAAPAWQIPGAKLAPQAYAAADNYIEEREGKRARGIDVPRHVRYSPTTQPLSFAGLRSVDGCTLALLDRGDAVLVMPVDSTTSQRLKGLSIGQFITVTPKGSLAAGHSRGRSR